MESRFELVGGEQNGQTVQPLVANQNVESLAHEITKRKNREAAKKRREEKKQKTEDTERQLENARAENVELKKRVDKQKKKHAVSSGKLEQMQKYIELIIGDRKLLQQAIELQITTAKQQNTMINILMQRLVPGTTGFDTGETGLPVQHPTVNQPGAKMEPPGPVIEESSPQSHYVDQPIFHLDGLAPGGDQFGSHGLNTSPPRAAMASGNPLMEALLAAGVQLPWEMTPGNTFGTREAGPSVRYPPVYLPQG